MKVLVTGAGGFVGEYLIRLLKQHEHDVVAIGINNGKFLHDMQVTSHVVNIMDFQVLQEVMRNEKPDAVFHLAAISNVPISWENPELTVDINVHGTINVLQALYKVNPNAKFINIGSSDEYGLTAKQGIPLTEDMPCQPQNPYAISKYSAEQVILQLGKKYDMNVVSTRSFNHYGPGQVRGFVISDFAYQIAAIESGKIEAVLKVGNLTVSRDFTFVTDVVEAYVALLENKVPSGIYNVCSGVARELNVVLQDLLNLASVNIDVSVVKEKFRVSEVPVFIGSAEKIQNTLGWCPQYDYIKGLIDTLEYWRHKL